MANSKSCEDKKLRSKRVARGNWKSALLLALNYKPCERLEAGAGGRIGEGGKRGERGVDMVAGPIEREVHAAGLVQPALKLGRIQRAAMGEGITKGGANVGGRFAQAMQGGQRELSQREIDAEGLADFLRVADHVENVINDLKSDADGEAVLMRGRNLAGVTSGVISAEFTGGGRERAGLTRDEVHVLFDGQVRIAAMMILQEFAFADSVGGCADTACGVLVCDAAAQVV